MKLLTKLIILAIFVISTTSISGQSNIQENLTQVLNKLKNSLNEHKFEVVEPHLSVEFSYNSYTGEMARIIMRQIVDQYPKTIESMRVTGYEKRETGYEIFVDIDTGDEVQNQSILLSENFKILKAEIVQIQIHDQSSNSNNEVSKNKRGFPKETIVPFELAGKLIVVDAEIEGKRGKFLVDSGASRFWIEKSVFPNLLKNAEPSEKSPEGAGGKTSDVYQVSVKDFIWQDIKLEEITAFIGDLTYLSSQYNMEFIGIIGSELLHNFTVLFDYSNKRITLLYDQPSDQWQTAPDFELDFQMIGHLPVIKTEIGGSKLNFGIDCGAETAMLFTAWEEKLKDYYNLLSMDVLMGIDQKKQDVKKIELIQFRIGELQYDNQTFIIGDLQFGHKVMMDGLLGYEFLSNYNTAINFPERKMYFWIPESES